MWHTHTRSAAVVRCTTETKTLPAQLAVSWLTALPSASDLPPHLTTLLLVLPVTERGREREGGEGGKERATRALVATSEMQKYEKQMKNENNVCSLGLARRSTRCHDIFQLFSRHFPIASCSRGMFIKSQRYVCACVCVGVCVLLCMILSLLLNLRLCYYCRIAAVELSMFGMYDMHDISIHITLAAIAPVLLHSTTFLLLFCVFYLQLYFYTPPSLS